jgi:hypothetical protein
MVAVGRGIALGGTAMAAAAATGLRVAAARRRGSPRLLRVAAGRSAGCKVDPYGALALATVPGAHGSGPYRRFRLVGHYVDPVPRTYHLILDRPCAR